MNPTTEQKIAIEIQDRALVVEAGAGTGKTWVLVQRFLHLLEAHPHWPLDSLIAITFTEKAAREMRTRVRLAIEAKALADPDNPQWQAHRQNLDRMQVSTIHSLCSRILRENAIAAEIAPRFQVLDQQEADLLKEEAIRETIQALDDENHPALALLASLRVYDLREEMGSMLSKRGTLNQLFPDLGEPDDLLIRWEAGLDEMRAALWQEQLQSCPDLLDRCSEIVGIQITDPTDKLSRAVQAAQKGARAASQGALVDAIKAWKSINRSGGRAANWGGKDAKNYGSMGTEGVYPDVGVK
jgi:ATP-dependent helicase/nuclease subunit A